MKKMKKNGATVQKLSATAKRIDKQLMDLLVSELENFRSSARAANPMKIA
ncbi:hypothetical protein GCM10023231_11180 [Olivibacter ginsenosidimutans]|uniref:Uncharacterized protein n=1 Tax=Olivibacter ginsenosidimutans TaxID=1176537 RepID=A0ABP9AS44_9SPHI